MLSDIGASHKLEDDSAYKTYSMPGDDEDHSSELYSELSDIGTNFKYHEFYRPIIMLYGAYGYLYHTGKEFIPQIIRLQIIINYCGMIFIGHNVPVKIIEKNEIVCGSGKVPGSTLIGKSVDLTATKNCYSVRACVYTYVSYDWKFFLGKIFRCD